MNDKSYTATIELGKSLQDVFDHLKDVSKWWSKDFEGSSARLGDEFVICHPDRHYSKQKLVEVIHGKKIVWLVTDSKLNWLEKDKDEWTGTKMIFELAPKDDKAVLHFTHEGLVPEKECYAMCERGWNMVIKERLVSYITDGKAI
jgi:Activator of Hsp90 ATPase homolog 1-like protein